MTYIDFCSKKSTSQPPNRDEYITEKKPESRKTRRFHFCKGQGARNFIESDAENAPFTNSKAIFSIFLPPLPLISTNFIHSLDEFPKNANREHKYISWNTGSGKYELKNRYIYIDEAIGVDKASLELEKCEINIEKQILDLGSPENLFVEIDKEAEDITIIISFIYRKYAE